jgi:ribosomal protein S18 acetylase RimI-like enzyme
MVGMAILLPFKDSFAFIENVSVFFPYQSQGIATKLINTLFVAARLFHNAKYVELRCDKKKIPANALYRSVGFFLYNTHEELNIYRHDLGLKTQIALQGRQIE